MKHNYDLIIVGGRVAGASLAARLGRAGREVLVLDKARFPSRPAVSAPFVLPHALELLDELELDEAEYAAETPKLERLVLEMGPYFRTHLRFPRPIAGRRHFYAVDRARFDACLWGSLASLPSVTAVEGAKVEGLLRDEDGRVCGVRARLPDADGPVELRARCVVGADGRTSLVAREVEAPVTHERTDTLTRIYYAHWRGVAPYDQSGDTPAHIHASCDGFSCVIMPSAAGECMVLTQGRLDFYAALEGSPQEIYERLLRDRPALWRRLAEAEQVSELRGLKQFANLFRQAHGPGWALVGDAYHQKDSLDAQGIYDALLGAKLLAEALAPWPADDRELDAALADYAERAEAALRPMFDATMDRVQRELYDIPPPFVAKTVLRWVLTNPDYIEGFMDVVTRRRDPRGFMAPKAMVAWLAGGARARLRSKLRGGEDPSDPYLQA